MKLENWVLSESSPPPKAFILIKLEPAVGQIVVASLLNCIYAFTDKRKKKQVQRRKLALFKVLSISGSKVFLGSSPTLFLALRLQ